MLTMRRFRRIDTGDGMLGLEIFEDGVPPRFRIRFEGRHDAFVGIGCDPEKSLSDNRS
jgi:hypothetical protein